LCCVVLEPGTHVGVDELRSYLAERVAKWWVPEQWTFLDSIPKTSVGKFDKKLLRSRFHDGDLTVIVTE